VDALGKLNCDNFTVDVVVGKNNPNLLTVEKGCGQLRAYNFHCQVANVAEIMSMSDLAIGAGGTTTWERCSMMLPSVIIAIAGNQVPIAKAVQAAGAAVYVGESEDVDEKKICETLEELLSSPRDLKLMGERAGQLVDAKGTQRVVEAVMECA
jgi:UDP-2,4-diacetamido-2,4,6-trideoxy-beta-L-altropyranose hydrolase